MTNEAIDILNNLMANVATSYHGKDWELLKTSYLTAVDERKLFGLPPFVGAPSIKC